MDKSKSDVRIVKSSLFKDVCITDPKARLANLANYASSVHINPAIHPDRYYRSGIEMVREADAYLKDESLEHAFFLYTKFLTIFIDKIQHHPRFGEVSVKNKAKNKEVIKKVMPKAENLKKRLLQWYQAEFDEYQEDLRERERAEKERQQQEEEQRLKEEEQKRNKLALLAAVKAAKAATKETVVIPSTDLTSKHYPTVTPKPATALREENQVHYQLPKEKITPVVDRSTKPAALVTDSLTLRDMILPSKLLKSFLILAARNTMNNKETCGILAGRLERNKLIVSHLLIPHQTGSPDSCITHNEEDIFDYQDQYDLITLGWIHTHPTQTAFLSSVDLHTHYAYQLMMAEAIAIVCAPKYDETGFFILTPEYGLEFIANCKETGFHPHPTDPPLYMRAKHYKLDSMAPIEVIDLRTNYSNDRH